MSLSLQGQSNEQRIVAQAVVEPRAFAAIYDHYFPRVYNYVRYRVKDAAAADDVTARVFERALSGLGSYQPEKAPFGAWLFAIARHAVFDHLRRGQRQAIVPLDAIDNRPGPGIPPEQQAIDREWRQRLLAAVAELPERDQEIIALKFGAGFTNATIADMLGLSASNVGVILHRAIKKLRMKMGPQSQEGQS